MGIMNLFKPIIRQWLFSGKSNHLLDMIIAICAKIFQVPTDGTRLSGLISTSEVTATRHLSGAQELVKQLELAMESPHWSSLISSWTNSFDTEEFVLPLLLALGCKANVRVFY